MIVYSEHKKLIQSTIDGIVAQYHCSKECDDCGDCKTKMSTVVSRANSCWSLITQ